MSPLSTSASVNPLAYLLAPGFVAAGATVAALFLMAAIGYYILFRPFLDRKSRKVRGGLTGFVWEVTTILPRAVKRTVTRHVQEHVKLLIRSYINGIDPLIVLMVQYDDVTRRIAGTIGDLSEQTWRALWTLNNETIPRKIATATLPLRQQLTRHTGRLDALEDLNRRVANRLGDTLRALPWGVPGGYVPNFETFLDRFVQLWEHYWNTTRGQITTLLQDTVPELRRDIADLARRLDVGIDARLDALGNRIAELERWRENVVAPRLAALSDAVDLLSDQVFGPVAGGLSALLERVVELERQLAEVVPAEVARLEGLIADLRLDLEQGIRTGLGEFAERIEALERWRAEVVAPALAAMQLAIDTIAAEIFEEVGAGLSALTARIVAIETWVFGELRDMVELALGRIEAIETQLRDDVLPRLRAVEALLEPAALAVAIMAALRIAAPNLFCRNVTDLTSRICADDETFWRDLLAGALVFAIALNPREVAIAGQALTGALGGVIAETVDH